MPLHAAPLVWLGLNLASNDVSCSPTTGVVTFVGNVPTVQNAVLNQAPHPLPWLGLNLGQVSGFKNPQTGVITFTGNVPTVMAGATLTGATGTVTFTGNVPTILNQNPSYTPATGVVTFSGNQALVTYQSLDQAVWHELPVHWYADVGYAARFIYYPLGILTQNRDSIATFDYQPTTGTVTFTGNAPSVALNINAMPTTGEVEFIGGIASVGLTVGVTPASNGVVTFTGNQPSINTQSLVNPQTGVITFTGYVPTLSLAVDVSPTTGLVQFLSQTPSIDTQETKVSPSTGLVTFTGNRPFYTGAINSLELVAPTPSGGWLRKKRKEWYERLPTREEIEAEREALGILPKKAQKVVKETVANATDSVSEKHAALLASAYLEETQQRNLVDRLRAKADKSKAKWTDEMFTITRALILDELRKKADADELERLLAQQEHEEVEASEILEIWMEQL